MSGDLGGDYMSGMSEKALVNRIDHIEVACGDLADMENLFTRLGFTTTQTKTADSGEHRMMVQGKTRFVITKGAPGTFAEQYAEKHGDGVCRLAFHSENAKESLQTAISRGATEIEAWREEGNDALKVSQGAISAFGDVRLTFWQRSGEGIHTFDIETPFAPGFTNNGESSSKNSLGFLSIDHLTNNVEKGKMQHWCDFYEKVFGFVEVRHFNIQGASTGLLSKVMQSPCGGVKIPINEPKEDKSQIQEYINEHKGAGVQHIALTTKDIVDSVGKLQQHDFQFLDVPDTYYEDLKTRLPQIDEPMDELQRLKILADGDTDSYLLQIFTQNQIGPLFFEFIQRHGHDGFGEGNFKALFEAIERDQKKRGVI